MNIIIKYETKMYIETAKHLMKKIFQQSFIHYIPLWSIIIYHF